MRSALPLLLELQDTIDGIDDTFLQAPIRPIRTKDSMALGSIPAGRLDSRGIDLTGITFDDARSKFRESLPDDVNDELRSDES